MNQHLYGICKKLTTDDGAFVIAWEGGAIPEVFAAAQELSLPRPKLINSGVQFKALLYLPADSGAPSVVPVRPVEDDVAPSTDGSKEPGSRASDQQNRLSVTKNQDEILRLFRSGEPVTLRRIVNETALSESQVRYALNKLMRAGRVVREGGQGDRSTSYRLV